MSSIRELVAIILLLVISFLGFYNPLKISGYQIVVLLLLGLINWNVTILGKKELKKEVEE